VSACTCGETGMCGETGLCLEESHVCVCREQDAGRAGSNEVIQGKRKCGNYTQ